MTYLPKPKQLSGFETTDGKIFPNIMEARAHENTISMLEWLENNGPVDNDSNTLMEWLDRHSERIGEYYYCYNGDDPDYMHER